MATQAQIDALLPFLEIIESDNSPEVMGSFIDTLYENKWIVPFDWSSWQDEAESYAEHPDKTASASVKTIQKLLTTHVRKDRFCEGHLDAMVENGHIAALLRRLKDLRGK